MSHDLFKYWLAIASQVAQKSKCLSRKIGALIITPDNTIVGTGYNGPPRGVVHCDSPERLEWIIENVTKTHFGNVRAFLEDSGWGTACPRHLLGYKSGDGLYLCIAGHAERNAIVNSAREGIRTKGCFLVLNTVLPCKDCMIEIINAGITKIICYAGPDYDPASRWLAVQVGTEIIQITI